MSCTCWFLSCMSFWLMQTASAHSLNEFGSRSGYCCCQCCLTCPNAAARFAARFATARPRHFQFQSACSCPRRCPNSCASQACRRCNTIREKRQPAVPGSDPAASGGKWRRDALRGNRAALCVPAAAHRRKPEAEHAGEHTHGLGHGTDGRDRVAP